MSGAEEKMMNVCIDTNYIFLKVQICKYIYMYTFSPILANNAVSLHYMYNISVCQRFFFVNSLWFGFVPLVRLDVSLSTTTQSEGESKNTTGGHYSFTVSQINKSLSLFGNKLCGGFN